MQPLSQYIMSLTAAAMICGTLLSLFQSSSMHTVIRMICGVFMTITVLGPLCDFSFPDLFDIIPDFQEDAAQAAAWGEDFSAQLQKEHILQSLQAYIQDKASELDVTITAQFNLDRQGIPNSVRIHGNITGQKKEALSQLIANELGIAKENQQWTG